MKGKDTDFTLEYLLNALPVPKWQFVKHFASAHEVVPVDLRVCQSQNNETSSRGLKTTNSVLKY